MQRYDWSSMKSEAGGQCLGLIGRWQKWHPATWSLPRNWYEFASWKVGEGRRRAHIVVYGLGGFASKSSGRECHCFHDSYWRQRQPVSDISYCIDVVHIGSGVVINNNAPSIIQLYPSRLQPRSVLNTSQKKRNLALGNYVKHAGLWIRCKHCGQGGHAERRTFLSLLLGHLWRRHGMLGKCLQYWHMCRM